MEQRTLLWPGFAGSRHLKYISWVRAIYYDAENAEEREKRKWRERETEKESASLIRPVQSLGKSNGKRRKSQRLSTLSTSLVRGIDCQKPFSPAQPPPPPIRHSLHLQPPFFHFQSETRSIIVVWFVSYSSGRAHWLGRVYRCWFMMVRNIPGWRVDSSGRLCV